jgi:PadR family transcriptional regulator PadR
VDILRRDEIPPGTLYLLILKTLRRSGELHGYEIANSIQLISDHVLQVEEGSLYPALQRMLIKGWVTAKWGTTSGNRRARYYQLTPAGRKQLAAEVSQFERVIRAITRVIETA